MKIKKAFSILMSFILGVTFITAPMMPEVIAQAPPPPEENDGLIILEEKPNSQDVQDAAKRSREQGILPGLAGFDQTVRAVSGRS